MLDCNHDHNLLDNKSDAMSSTTNKAITKDGPYNYRLTDIAPSSYTVGKAPEVLLKVSNPINALRVISVSIIEKKNKKYMKASLISYGENISYKIGDFIDIKGCQFKIKKIEYTDNAIIVEAKSKFNLGIDYISKVKNAYIEK